MSPPLKTPSTERTPPRSTPSVLLEAPYYLWTRGLRARKESTIEEQKYKDPCELKRDRRRNEGERGQGNSRGCERREGKGWRATRGPSTMDRLGDSEMSRPTTLNGRRMRTLPQLDRRTMHPGRRMLTLAITWFNAGMDGFSALLSVSEPPIVATVASIH